MPYIPESARSHQDLISALPILSEGELNFVITKLIDSYIESSGGVRYRVINEVIGVLECAKLELYRRIAAPYEDAKCLSNGDVYACIQ